MLVLFILYNINMVSRHKQNDFNTIQFWIFNAIGIESFIITTVLIYFVFIQANARYHQYVTMCNQTTIDDLVVFIPNDIMVSDNTTFLTYNIQLIEPYTNQICYLSMCYSFDTYYLDGNEMYCYTGTSEPHYFRTDQPVYLTKNSAQGIFVSFGIFGTITFIYLLVMFMFVLSIAGCESAMTCLMGTLRCMGMIVECVAAFDDDN